MDETLAEVHHLVENAKRVAGLPALFARFIDNAESAWVIVNRGIIVLFNRKAVFLFGYQPEQVIGKPVEILLPAGLRERHAAVHRPGYERDPYTRPMGANRDLLALHRNGSTFPVLIDLQSEMSDDGEQYNRAAIRRKDLLATGAEQDAPAVCPVSRGEADFGGG